MMTLPEELSAPHPDRFAVLILDNEVTVRDFVIEPPLPWTRLVPREGGYRAAEGYPTVLSAAQANFEMKNWDQVQPAVIAALLNDLKTGVDYVLFGNNAGQGLPLARNLAPELIADRAAIVYAKTLPERSQYEQLGFRNFFPRSEAASRLVDLAAPAKRAPSLYFINTIQHNEQNYHDP